MGKKVLSFLIVATVLSVLLATCGGGDEATATRVPPTPTLVPPTLAPTTPPSTGGGEAIEVTLVDEGRNYRFRPVDFTFKVGEKVRLKLTSESEFHTFTATDLPTQEGQEISVFVNGSGTVEVEFTPSQAGTFDLICIPHQSFGMIGTITVNP